jgi:hypothetical protein
MPLYSGSASGCGLWKIFDNSAFGYWLLAFGQKTNSVRDEAWVLSLCDPLPAWDWVWVALGWPKRGPRATQAPRKHRPSVDLWKCFVCNRNGKRVGGAEGNRRNRASSPTSHVIGKQNSFNHKGHEGTQRMMAIPGRICISA